MHLSALLDYYVTVHYSISQWPTLYNDNKSYFSVCPVRCHVNKRTRPILTMQRALERHANAPMQRALERHGNAPYVIIVRSVHIILNKEIKRVAKDN